MEFYNSALIQDEILLNISLVLDRGYPVGPSFLHSLGTLIEASVIHDKLYFDPAKHAQDRQEGNRNANGQETVASIVYDSSFVQQLIKENLLTPFPNGDEIDSHLKSTGSDYGYWDFISDLMWRYTALAVNSPEEEKRLYISQAFLIEDYPTIFQSEELVDEYSSEGEIKFSDPKILELASRGFPTENIIQWEGWNHLVFAYGEMARNLGLNLYLTNLALPHQLGSIKIGNQRTREMYNTIINKLESIDDVDVGKPNYYRVEVPPLCQIVLSNCKDSSKALAKEILNLRHKHRNFARYLTEYDKAWDIAKTRKDRIKLKNEFDNAWKTLMEIGEKPSSRLVYTLWDILKNPTSILENLGDKIADKGKNLSVIGRVRGLYDFWNDLLQTPTPENAQNLVFRLFPNRMEEKTWEEANNFNRIVNNSLEKFN